MAELSSVAKKLGYSNNASADVGFKIPALKGIGRVLFIGAGTTAAGTYAAGAWTFAGLAAQPGVVGALAALPGLIVSPPALAALGGFVGCMIALKMIHWGYNIASPMIRRLCKFMFGNAVEAYKNYKQKQAIDGLDPSEIQELQNLGANDTEKLQTLKDFSYVKKALLKRTQDLLVAKDSTNSITPDVANGIANDTVKFLSDVSTALLAHVVANHGIKKSTLAGIPLVYAKGNIISDTGIEKIVSDALKKFDTELTAKVTAATPPGTPPVPGAGTPTPTPPAPVVLSAAALTDITTHKDALNNAALPYINEIRSFSGISRGRAKTNFVSAINTLIDESHELAKQVANDADRSKLLTEVQMGLMTRLDAVRSSMTATTPPLGATELNKAQQGIRNFGIDLWLKYDPTNASAIGKNTTIIQTIRSDTAQLVGRLLEPTTNVDDAKAVNLITPALENIISTYQALESRVAPFLKDRDKQLDAQGIDADLKTKYAETVKNLSAVLSKFARELRGDDPMTLPHNERVQQARTEVEALVDLLSKTYEADIKKLETT